MDAKLKKKWVSALRSGKYKQGTYGLKFGGRHCCIGVLCEAAGLRIKSGDEELLDVVGGIDLMDWTDEELLIEANDNHGWSFPEIADYIEVMVE